MKTKYIIIEYEAIPMPVVFSELMTHADVAGKLGGKVHGAGFCYRDDEGWHCYGESVSLKVKSRGEVDAKVFDTFEM